MFTEFVTLYIYIYVKEKNISFFHFIPCIGIIDFEVFFNS